MHLGTMELALCDALVDDPAEDIVARCTTVLMHPQGFWTEAGLYPDRLEYRQSSQTHSGKDTHLSKSNAVRYLFSKERMLPEFLIYLH